jgi:hypothetical protein
VLLLVLTHIKLLGRIASITPERRYYPTNEKVMQEIPGSFLSPNTMASTKRLQRYSIKTSEKAFFMLEIKNSIRCRMLKKIF